MPLNLKGYITLKAAALSLGVSRQTVYKLIERNLLSQGEKLPGGGHVFPVTDIERLKQTPWFTANRRLRRNRAPA